MYNISNMNKYKGGMVGNILELSSQDLPQVEHSLATGILAGSERLGGGQLGELDHIGESLLE